MAAAAVFMRGYVMGNKNFSIKESIGLILSINISKI